MKHAVRVILFSWAIISIACNKGPKMGASALEGFSGHVTSRQLTPEIITGMKDEDVEQAVVDNIIIDLQDDGAGVTAEKIAKLDSGQRAIYVTWIWEAKMTKGGFDYFFKHTAKTITSRLKESLQTVDAPHFAEITDQAFALYESIQSGQVKDQDYPFTELDESISDLKKIESLDAIKVRYIRNHPEEFLHN